MSSASAELFHHEALLYEGLADFVRCTEPFVREGLETGEDVMVAVTADKLELLRSELGARAEAVAWVDMAELGRNPARIIPAWRDFAERRRPGHGMRGIGEPIWAGRSEDELVECQVHEALLNLAFQGTERFRLACPYDTTSLGDFVIHEALCSHPHVTNGEAIDTSRHYRGASPNGFLPFDAPLPTPPPARARLSFDEASLREVRELVAAYAAEAGIDERRTSEAVLAVHEIATNSVRHGGGAGVLHMWRSGDAVIAEVRDRGHIDDPLVGRHLPTTDVPGGWGCFVANQLCDLTQFRSDSDGTTVRLFVRAN